MRVVLDKIFNGEYQYQVVDAKGTVLSSGYETWAEAQRFVIRNR